MLAASSHDRVDASGTWYFAVSADAADGTQSAMSNVGSKTIRWKRRLLEPVGKKSEAAEDAVPPLSEKPIGFDGLTWDSFRTA
jgi:hypothetical protein